MRYLLRRLGLIAWALLVAAGVAAWVVGHSRQLRAVRIADNATWSLALLAGDLRVIGERLPPHTRNVTVTVGDRTLPPGTYFDALPRAEARAERLPRPLRNLALLPPGDKRTLWRRLGFTRQYAVSPTGAHAHLLTAPYWVVPVGLALPGLPAVWRRARARRRAAAGHCPACGYDLRATPQGGRCPECGATAAIVGAER